MSHSAFPATRSETTARSRLGPHHQKPPCRHFPECGGCQLQHVDDEAYRGYLVSRVETALDQHGLKCEIRDPHLSPPNSRRRASLRALRVGQGAVIGFNAAKSHRIVDMQEDHILRRELFDLVAPLRGLLSRFLAPRRTAEIQLTLVDQGADLLVKGIEPEGYEAMEALTAFCEKHRHCALVDRPGTGTRSVIRAQPGHDHIVRHVRRLSGRRIPSGHRRWRGCAGFLRARSGRQLRQHR